jgi:type IV secretion system protein VirB9
MPRSGIRPALTLALLVAPAIVGGLAVKAADVPTPGERDARVRYVEYVRDQVTVIHVRRGVVTRLMLEPAERIRMAATGFSADCAKAELEWCVRADHDANQIWVKPKDGATHNNLELHTDRRDYSIEFRVLPDAPKGRGVQPPTPAEPMFRVIFQYPLAVPVSQMLSTGAMPVQGAPAARTRTLQGPEPPTPRNWSYSMQVLAGAEDIVPSLVFDDGRFTYFQFPGNREVPSIFVISADGEEGRVNYHMDGDLAVVQRTSRRFVLRLGKAVVGVWNDAFDAEGVPPRAGTTSEQLRRTVR